MFTVGEKIDIKIEDLDSKVEKEVYDDILTMDIDMFYFKYFETRAKVKMNDKLTAFVSAFMIMMFFAGLYGLYEGTEISFITSFDLCFIVSLVLFVFLFKSYSNKVKTLKVYEYVAFLLEEDDNLIKKII